MLKKAIVLLSLLGTFSAHAAKLNIACTADGAKKLAVSVVIRNVNGDYDRAEVRLNDVTRDTNSAPVYNLVPRGTNGSFDIGLVFRKDISSVKNLQVSVKNCMGKASDPTKDPSSIYYGSDVDNGNADNSILVQRGEALVVERPNTFGESTTKFYCTCDLK